MTPWRIRRVQNVLHVDKKGLLQRHNLRQNLSPVLDRNESSPRCQ
jgi:hypothetical protein